MAKSSGKAGSLFYGMTLFTGDFSKNLKKARKLLKQSGEAMRDSMKMIAGGFAIITGAAGVAAVGMLAFAKSTAESNNEQILLAKSIGATQAEIAGLEVASTRFGVSQDMLIDKMREAGGVDAFKKIAEQVAGAGDASKQLAKAQELLGNEGLKLLPILQQGAAGLNAMEQEAKSLGLALSPKQIEQNNLAWSTFEDTMLKVKGLSTQIGTEFLSSFAFMSAGVDAFLDTFKSDIMGAFETVSKFMFDSIKFGLEVFSKHGIPFINGFISFANQIGDAFDNIFSFIRGEGDSTFTFLGKFFDGFSVFLATFSDSMAAGLMSGIEFVIKGAFGMLSSFNQFIGDMVVGLATIVQMIPGVSDELAGKISKAFDEVSKDIEGMGDKLAAPFKKSAEDNINAMAITIEKQRKKNEKMQAKFTGVMGKMGEDWKAATRSAAEVAETNKKIVKDSIGISDKRGGLSLTGSQAAIRLRNPTADKQLAISTQILSETKKSRMAQERIQGA